MTAEVDFASMTKHSNCSSMDPSVRRTAGARLFEVLGARGVVLRVMEDFYLAKKSLDEDPDARSVRCPRCGSLLAARTPTPARSSTEAFVRYVGG